MSEESAARGLAYTSTDYIVGVVSGDVDADGDYDLVIQHGGANAVEVAFNDGTGNYTVQAHAAGYRVLGLRAGVQPRRHRR